MPVDPQQIPYAPQAQNPVPPFQGGPYAQIAAEQIAKRPTGLDYLKGISGMTNDALNTFLNQQRLQQQAPLVQAQTQDVRSQAQQRQAETNYQYGNQPSSPSMAGTSQYAAPPGGSYAGSDQTQPGQSMSSSGGQGGTPSGGFSPQMPMSVMPNAAGGIPSGPNQNMTPNDPFAHMHMDPSQPYALHPQLQQTAQIPPQYDPEQLGVDMRQVGAKYYQTMASAQQARAAASATGRAGSAILGKYGINVSPSDIAASSYGEQPGTLLRAGMEGVGLGNRMSIFNMDKQQAANTEGQKLFNDYVNTATASQTALKALDAAQKNPGSFNTALLSVGQALGVNSRNPEMIVKTIADSDPSIAGKINAWVSQKGQGKLDPSVLSGLQTMINGRAQANQQAFEQKATSHAQQNAQWFGGDVNQAKRAIFPQYQWGQTQQPGQGGQGGQGTGQVLTATNPKTGAKVKSMDGGKTWQPM